MEYSTKVFGKWILAGEHAVLRGAPALVFPLSSRSMELQFTDSSKKDHLSLELSGEHGEELQLLFWGILERACEIAKVRRADLFGQVKIKSGLPVGAGLGASAALSVAVTKWFEALRLIRSEIAYEFARQLEDLFHGESSGVDIAVAMSGRPLRFIRNGPREEFAPVWKPSWYISYSGKRGVTAECVAQVKDFIAKKPGQALEVDQQMLKATNLAQSALQTSQDQGLAMLKDAIDMALSCFDQWGLIESSSQRHLTLLRDAGALAAKPTGSGNGGYMLSLWSQAPPQELTRLLIPC